MSVWCAVVKPRKLQKKILGGSLDHDIFMYVLVFKKWNNQIRIIHKNKIQWENEMFQTNCRNIIMRNEMLFYMGYKQMVLL